MRVSGVRYAVAAGAVWVGGDIEVGKNGYNNDAVGTADGGYVTAWTGASFAGEAAVMARVFSAAGQPRGAGIPVSDVMFEGQVAASPRGGFPVAALNGQRKLPIYSDLLLHDMGPGLADGIRQGSASGSEFRTPPLWGAKYSAPYLHDGRAATLAEAIAAHGGEAQPARDRFLALSERDRRNLIAFLESL